MLCECHGREMYWNRDARHGKGGYWRCREARRPFDARQKANMTPEQREVHAAHARARYDRDPIYRIGKRLHDAAHKRAQTSRRMRDRLEDLT